MGKLIPIVEYDIPPFPWEDAFGELEGAMATFKNAAAELERLLVSMAADDEAPVTLQDAAAHMGFASVTHVREVGRHHVRVVHAALDATQAILEAERTGEPIKFGCAA